MFPKSRIKSVEGSSWILIKISRDRYAEIFVHEKIEEIFGRRIVPTISGWAVTNRELMSLTDEVDFRQS